MGNYMDVVLHDNVGKVWEECVGEVWEEAVITAFVFAKEEGG